MPSAEVFWLVIFALLAGGFGAVIGAGGGFVIVPALVLLFGRAPEEAVGITALAVLLISMTSTLSYLPRGRVDLRLALIIAAPGIPAAAVGSWLLGQVASGPAFTLALGVCFLLLAGLMVLQMRSAAPLAAASSGALAAGGGAVGVITGAFAAGGGLLTIPLLMRWGALPIERATATTAVAVIPSAAAAAAAQIWLGHVPANGIAIAVAAAAGAWAGATWSGRWRPRNLLLLTVAAVGGMGLLTLARALAVWGET